MVGKRAWDTWGGWLLVVAYLSPLLALLTRLLLRCTVTSKRVVGCGVGGGG